MMSVRELQGERWGAGIGARKARARLSPARSQQRIRRYHAHTELGREGAFEGGLVACPDEHEHPLGTRAVSGSDLDDSRHLTEVVELCDRGPTGR
jgi:hypothetical protein